MIKYLKRTWKNKVAALAAALFGYATTFIDNDGTFFMFALCFAIPMFFARNNFID